MDDKNAQFQAQQEQNPETIDVNLTGNHPRGNSLIPDDQSVSETIKQMKTEGLIWIERADQAKQGMARKVDMRNARAAPDHPHIGHLPGSGEIQ